MKIKTIEEYFQRYLSGMRRAGAASPTPLELCGLRALYMAAFVQGVDAVALSSDPELMFQHYMVEYGEAAKLISRDCP